MLHAATRSHNVNPKHQHMENGRNAQQQVRELVAREGRPLQLANLRAPLCLLTGTAARGAAMCLRMEVQLQKRAAQPEKRRPPCFENRCHFPPHFHFLVEGRAAQEQKITSVSGNQGRRAHRWNCYASCTSTLAIVAAPGRALSAQPTYNKHEEPMRC